MPYIGTCFRFYTQMWVENNNKAFAYRVPIGDYNYLQCIVKPKSVKLTNIDLNNSKNFNLLIQI